MHILDVRNIGPWDGARGKGNLGGNLVDYGENMAEWAESVEQPSKTLVPLAFHTPTIT